MRNFSRFFLILFFTIPVVLTSTAGGVKHEYKTDPATGVKYCFLKQDKKKPKPSIGDVAYVRIVYKRADDSLLFDSHVGRTDSTSLIPLTIQKNFPGSLEQGLSMMSVGDSASFLVSADSIYLKVFKLKAIPSFIKKGTDLTFYIKLVKFKTPEQVKQDQYAQMEKQKAEIKNEQHAEATSITKYLKDKNITTKPTVLDSLYILERSGTIGTPINEGDSIEVKYTGMFLNGKVFDQSNKGDGGKGTFKLQFTHKASLIKGWIEVLAHMHEGEKVKILLPSSMAYGSSGAGKEIKAYTPLLFDIEVVKVTSPFDTK